MDLSDEEIGKRFRDDPSRYPVTGHRLIKGKGPYNKLLETYGLDARRKESSKRTIRNSRYGRFREVYKTARNQSNLPKCDLLGLMRKLAGHSWSSDKFEQAFEDRIGP